MTPDDFAKHVKQAGDLAWVARANLQYWLEYNARLRRNEVPLIDGDFWQHWSRMVFEAVGMRLRALLTTKENNWPATISLGRAIDQVASGKVVLSRSQFLARWEQDAHWQEMANEAFTERCGGRSEDLYPTRLATIDVKRCDHWRRSIAEWVNDSIAHPKQNMPNAPYLLKFVRAAAGADSLAKKYYWLATGIGHEWPINTYWSHGATGLFPHILQPQATQ